VVPMRRGRSLWQIAAGQAGMRAFLSELKLDEVPDFIGVECLLIGSFEGCGQGVWGAGGEKAFFLSGLHQGA